MTLANNSYSVEISENPDLSMLKSAWKKLEANNRELSFFHSWDWIATWLKIYNPDVLLVSARFNGETVALGLFGKSLETRYKILKSRQIRLFQTGDQMKDQIWVEFNDFLCDPDHLEEASKACLNALLSQQCHFDEIVVSMIVKSRADALMRDFANVNVILDSPAFKTNLKQLSSNNRHYLESLNRNTRYQIKRSRRIYESQYGTLQISFAGNSKQALQYWTEAGELHTKRWSDSGFLNPEFVNFHKEFIMNNFDTGRVDLARITAGNHLIAIIYNIIYKNNVYFYLQGIQPENNGKLKPGLTAHSMLIEHYLHQDMESYDFMGGYSQYKKQLSQVSESLLIIIIQKPLLKFRLENIARNFKRKLLQPDNVSP